MIQVAELGNRPQVITESNELDPDMLPWQIMRSHLVDHVEDHGSYLALRLPDPVGEDVEAQWPLGFRRARVPVEPRLWRRRLSPELGCVLLENLSQSGLHV